MTPHPPRTHKKQSGRKRAQLLPELPTSHWEEFSQDEATTPSIRDVMSALGGITARLELNEERINNLTSHRGSQDWADDS